MVSVSTLGQTLEQISRLNTNQTQLDELNRQIATGKQTDKFAGYSTTDTISVQRIRTDLNEVDSYLNNIKLVNPRIELTQTTVNEILAQADVVLNSLRGELQEGDFDSTTVQSFAGDALDIIQDIMNTEINGRYLLSGDDVGTPPYSNAGALQSNVTPLITNFLNGTSSPTQFMTSLNGLNDTQLGYSATLQTSGDVFTRIDRGVELDYTARANEAGFSDVIRSLEALSQLTFPQEGVDLATEDDFFAVLNDLENLLSDGIDGVQETFNNLERDRVRLANTESRLIDERALLQTQLEGIEEVDPAEAIVKFQSVQTQLEASFQVTAILANTSLINFIS